VVLDSLPTSRLFNLGENTLATKGKKSPAKSSTTKVTRIKASDEAKPVTKKAAASPAKTKTPKVTPVVTTEEEKPKRRNPLRATGDYFAGAWYELRQVRWPNRRATWGMTAALLAFTAFFVVLILLLDALFKYLFELILG